MRVALLLALTLVLVIGFSSHVLAQSCGDGTCDDGEDSSSCPDDCGTPDPCDGVTCESSSTTCEDGFVATCSNSCSGGTCSECTPDCSGHDVPATSCGDGTCDSEESQDSCPSDCGSASTCGDGVCDVSEDSSSCPSDCPFAGFCGDGSCDSDEDPATCPVDCGSACGDGSCNFGEDCSSCSTDCGVCTTCGDGVCEAGEDVDCPGDCETCGNGVCGGGEDKFNCASDCGFCGDDVCSGGETDTSCPDDCGGSTFCGDGVCDVSEQDWCSDDCKSGSGTCGNYVCDSGEDTFNCPQDCGVGFNCGDGICDNLNGEDVYSCADDCPGWCGDTLCEGEEGDWCFQDCGCPDGGSPVCGFDGNTYPNDCFANEAGAGIQCDGECPCEDDDFFCPQSTFCADGTEVDCYEDNGFCECNCPLPPGCFEEIDEWGYSHVVCEGTVECPFIPPAAEDTCFDEGGYPKFFFDQNGCEVMECDFGGQGGFFGGGECPFPEQIDEDLRVCEELGLEGRVVFENGCEIGKCVQEKEFCPEEEKYDLRVQKKDACLNDGGYPRTDFDSRGCEITVCDQGPNFCERHLPPEAYKKCDREGGELIVEHSQEGCIDFVECVRPGDRDDAFYERVDEVPSVTRLLEIAFNLEELSQKLDELARKTAALADYYTSVGSPEEGRLQRASLLFKEAMEDVRFMKEDLQNNLDHLTTEDIERFKHELKLLKEERLRDILYVMLSNSEEAERRYEREERHEFGPDDGFDEFNEALKNCEITEKWNPDPMVEVEVLGLGSTGCRWQATMTQFPFFDMTCEMPLGDGFDTVGENGPGPEEMDEWKCVGSMADGIRSGNFGSGEDQEDELRRDNFGGPGGFDDEFHTEPFDGPADFDGPNQCSGCLDNGICDIGECDGCPDCFGGEGGF